MEEKKEMSTEEIKMDNDPKGEGKEKATSPLRFPDDETQKYVKRVIGLPGEKVTIEDAKIYINDSETPLKEDYLKETWTEATGPFEFEVPKDSYLVLGDNRNDSYDARYWDHTYVSKDKIIGKAYFIYYPFQRLGSLYK